MGAAPELGGEALDDLACVNEDGKVEAVLQASTDLLRDEERRAKERVERVEMKLQGVGADGGSLGAPESLDELAMEALAQVNPEFNEEENKDNELLHEAKIGETKASTASATEKSDAPGKDRVSVLEEKVCATTVASTEEILAAPPTRASLLVNPGTVCLSKNETSERQQEDDRLQTGSESTVDEVNTDKAHIEEAAEVQPANANTNSNTAEQSAEQSLLPLDPHQERLQATACMKLQSLWKGHKTRATYTKKCGEFRVVSLDCSLPGLPLKLRKQFAALSFKVVVWNLRDSTCVFKWEAVNMPLKRTLVMETILIPGMDEECVVSLFVEGRPPKLEAYLPLFQATLIDLRLQVIPETKAVAQRFVVPAQYKSHLSGKDPKLEFKLQVGAAPHSFTGWLWVSKGVDPINRSTMSRAPRLGEQATELGYGSDDRMSPLVRMARKVLGLALSGMKSLQRGSTKVMDLEFPTTSVLSPLGKSQVPVPPDLTLARQDVGRSNWAWDSYWAVVFEKKLYLYGEYGDSAPVCIIEGSSCRIISSIANPTRSAEAAPQIQMSKLKPEMITCNDEHCFREADTLSIIAQSRPHAITWITKLRASFS